MRALFTTVAIVALAACARRDAPRRDAARALDLGASTASDVAAPSSVQPDAIEPDGVGDAAPDGPAIGSDEWRMRRMQQYDRSRDEYLVAPGASPVEPSRVDDFCGLMDEDYTRAPLFRVRGSPGARLPLYRWLATHSERVRGAARGDVAAGSLVLGAREHRGHR